MAYNFFGKRYVRSVTLTRCQFSHSYQRHVMVIHASDLPQVQSLVHSIRSLCVLITCPVSMHPRLEILKSMNKFDVKNTYAQNIFVNIVLTLPFRRCQRPISWRTKVVLTSDRDKLFTEKPYQNFVIREILITQHPRVSMTFFIKFIT